MNSTLLIQGWSAAKPKFSQRLEKARLWAKLYPGMSAPLEDPLAANKIGKAFEPLFEKSEDLTKAIDEVLEDEGV